MPSIPIRLREACIAAAPLAWTLLLLTWPAASQTIDPPTKGEIPGNRGELVLPFVPGPPTYTRPESQAGSSEVQPFGTGCAPAQRTYLDPHALQDAPAVDADKLYSGWLAGELIGQDAYGRNGEQLGEVQDILVGPDQRITAITVEGGGFLGIGDAAFRVPWDMVELTPGRDGVRVDLSSEQAARQGLFDGPEVVDAGPREFRVSEVRGDWTRAGEECFVRRGYIRDVVFGRDGRILAVLETRAARFGGGTYAYPLFTYQQGWRPLHGSYDLPIENMARPAPKVDLSRFARGEAVGSR